MILFFFSFSFWLSLIIFFSYFLFHLQAVKKKVANSAWSARILASGHHLGLLHPPPYRLHTTTHLALPANKHRHRTPSQRLGSLHESQHSFTHFTYFQPNPIAPGTLGSSSWLIWFDLIWLFCRNWRSSQGAFLFGPSFLKSASIVYLPPSSLLFPYLILFLLLLHLLHQRQHGSSFITPESNGHRLTA